jgi:hypothetical protein
VPLRARPAKPSRLALSVVKTHSDLALTTFSSRESIFISSYLDFYVSYQYFIELKSAQQWAQQMNDVNPDFLAQMRARMGSKIKLV